MTPSTASGTRRTLFLDVDYTLIRPAASPFELFLARDEKRAARYLPKDYREAVLEVQLPQRDATERVYFRPATITAIAQLPAELDVRWLTSWMVNPPRLLQLQEQLDFAPERFLPADVPAHVRPSQEAFPMSMRALTHWKAQSVADHLRSDPEAEAVWADDEVGDFLHAIFPEDLRPRLHYVRPTFQLGMLEERDVAMIANWAAGNVTELRIDRETGFEPRRYEVGTE